MAGRSKGSKSPSASPSVSPGSSPGALAIRRKSEPVEYECRLSSVDSCGAETTLSDGSSTIFKRPPAQASFPPTAKDWENHRRIFTQLYSFENKTLDQVMEIMRIEYGFKATPRMFKQRVKDWDLHKNYKAAERKELAQIITVVKYHDVLGENRPRKVMLRGQPVKMHKLRKDLRNQSLSSKRLSELQDLARGIKSIPGQEVSVEDIRKRLMMTSAPMAPFATPQQLRDTEIILLQTDAYYGGFSIGMVPPISDTGYPPPCRDWCNNVDMAFELFKTGKTAKSFQLLDQALDQAKPMLLTFDPETLMNFLYDAADWSIGVPSDVFTTFWTFLTTMAATVLGENHPVAVVCKAIGSLEPGSLVFENSFRIIVSKMEMILGPAHRFTLSTKDRFNVLLCWSGNYYEAERLQRELCQHYDAIDKFNHEAVCAFYRLARILERSAKFKEAEAVYLECIERRNTGHCKQCPSYVHSAATLGLVACLNHYELYEESERHLNGELQNYVEHDIGDIVRIVHMLNDVQIKLGKMEEAEKLRAKYTQAF